MIVLKNVSLLRGVKPVLDQVLPLDQLPAAFARMAADRVRA